MAPSPFFCSFFKKNHQGERARKDGLETPFAFIYFVGRAAHHFIARFLPFNIASSCFFFKRRYKFPKTVPSDLYRISAASRSIFSFPAYTCMYMYVYVYKERDSCLYYIYACVRIPVYVCTCSDTHVFTQTQTQTYIYTSICRAHSFCLALCSSGVQSFWGKKSKKSTDEGNRTSHQQNFSANETNETNATAITYEGEERVMVELLNAWRPYTWPQPDNISSPLGAKMVLAKR